MFKVKIQPPQDLLDAIKTLPKRALDNYQVRLQRNVKPKVKARVDDLLATYPGNVKLPFKFSTPKSRRAYFATNGFGKGIPYRRTDSLKKAWEVIINTSGAKFVITIRNSDPAFKYVYGTSSQRQVPGHKNTGWGKDSDVATDLIQEEAIDLSIAEWQNAVDEEINQ